VNGSTDNGTLAGTLLGSTVYADGSSSSTLTNPFVTSTGEVSFYLATPQRVDLGITIPGQAPVFFADIDVLSASALAPVLSVNGLTGTVTITAASLGALTMIQPSGEPTGATDTANIQNAVNTNGFAFLGPGNFNINQPLLLAADGNSITGTAGTVITLVSAFSGGGAIQVTANDCGLSWFQLAATGNAALNGPAQIDAIQQTGCQRLKVDHIYAAGINGWVINTQATTGVFNADSMYTNITGRGCAGGFFAQSNPTLNYRGELFASNLQFQQMGAASGGAQGLDIIFLNDIDDVLMDHVNLGFALSATAGGYTLHAKDLGSSWLTDFDNGSALVEDSGTRNTGNVRLIRIGGPVTHTSNGSRVLYDSCFFGGPASGFTYSGTGDVSLASCIFRNSNSSAGTNYDLNITGSGNIRIKGCRFETPIGISIANNVPDSIFLATSNNAYLDGNQFSGSGAGPTNWFTNGRPQYARILGQGPGPTIHQPSMPSSGVAVGNNTAFDATVYLQATSIDGLAVNGTTVFTAAGGSGTGPKTMQVQVGAGQTFTPTYTGTLNGTWSAP
jgi:hypothetical protein